MKTYSCLIATCQRWSSTAALPRLLHQAAARVSLFAPGPLQHSRYSSQVIPAPRQPARAAAALRALLDEQAFDWIIVADDLLLGALADAGQTQALTRCFPVDTPDQSALELLLSKHAFIERAPVLGIAVPRSAFATSASAAVEAARAVGYPAIIKGDRGFGGREVHTVVCDQTARETAAGLLERYGRVAIQCFIDGQSVSASVLYSHGEVLGYRTYRTECGYPTPNAASTVHSYFAHGDIDRAVRILGAATRFHGLAGIDFIYDANNDAVLATEINPRPTIGFAGTRANRTFFAPLVADFLRAVPRQGVVDDGRSPVQVYFPDYLFYALMNLRNIDGLMLRRIRASVAEFDPVDSTASLFQIARFVYDRLCFALPELRSCVESRREREHVTVLPEAGRSSVPPASYASGRASVLQTADS